MEPMSEFETKLLEVLKNISVSLREIETDLDILGWDTQGAGDEKCGLEILTEISNKS